MNETVDLECLFLPEINHMILRILQMLHFTPKRNYDLKRRFKFLNGPIWQPRAFKSNICSENYTIKVSCLKGLVSSGPVSGAVGPGLLLEHDDALPHVVRAWRQVLDDEGIDAIDRP